MPDRNPPKPCSLYRFYDSMDRLLYVGISLSVLVRLAQHGRDKNWFKEISTIKVAHYADRNTARVQEVTAICQERPAYNKDAPPGRLRGGFCDYLSSLRASKHMTMAQVAEAAEMKMCSYRMIEMGNRSRLSRGELRRIAEALGEKPGTVIGKAVEAGY